jgi:hypothetical protein
MCADDVSELTSTDPAMYTRWLIACRALQANPANNGKKQCFPQHRASFHNFLAVNTEHFIKLPNALFPLAWRGFWLRQMPIQTTRDLNAFVRNISGLDISRRISFSEYAHSEQARAIRHVRAVFVGMSPSDALFHLNKAVSVYAGEQRRKAKVSLVAQGEIS